MDSDKAVSFISHILPHPDRGKGDKGGKALSSVSICVYLWFPLILLLSACAGVPQKAPDDVALVLEKSSFDALPGWAADRHAETLGAFARSCDRILKRDPGDKFGPVGGLYGDWQIPCLNLKDVQKDDDGAARRYFETWFAPWRAAADTGADTGLFTGYYESSLRGSLTRGGPYQTPLRRRPDDLVMVDLGLFREELKGQRIAGRVVDGNLKPYEDHRAIAGGKLKNDTDLHLIWVDDPVEAFFLQIQGSGRVLLDDGRTVRVGYAGQNGHPYYAVGRELVKRGLMAKDDVSMQSIRAWLKAHPDQAADLMFTNKSYVFFRMLDGEGPIGGEGVALTPGRSLAIDRARLPYGAPVWVDIAPPEDGDTPLRRLMIAQDTGGAIRGPVRGDFFWGYGPEAEHKAGLMKSDGQYWLLLPKTISRPQ